MLGGASHLDPYGNARLVLPQLAVYFLAVPEPKGAKNRLHIDLHSKDFDAAVARAERLGASVARDVFDGEAWRVLRDPEGNEFCILRPGAEGNSEGL